MTPEQPPVVTVEDLRAFLVRTNRHAFVAALDRLVAERDEAQEDAERFGHSAVTRMLERDETRRELDEVCRANAEASEIDNARGRAAERREAELREALALAFAGHTARAQVALAAVPAADPAPPSDVERASALGLDPNALPPGELKRAEADLDTNRSRLTGPEERPMVRFLDAYGNIISERPAVASKVGWGATIPLGATFVGVSHAALGGGS